MFKYISKISLGVCMLVLHQSCTAQPAIVGTFEPTEQQKITYQTAMQFLGSYHYNKPAFDNSFSRKALKNYIEILDPNKVYFLLEDSIRFEQYAEKLDDGIFSGDISPAFDIFNTYQKRLDDRIQYALTLLQTSTAFNTNDSFEIDREHAAFCSNFNQLDQLWRKKVTYELLVEKGTRKDTTAKYIDDVKKRYENLQKFTKKTKGDDVFQLFMNAILETIDPHTNYFSPKNAEDFNQSMSLSLEGIGAQLQTENEYTKIREIIKGGPADKSKQLFAGDRIVGVAQGKDSDIVNVIDWRIDDVVGLIRGKKGTSVRLKIIPASDPTSTKLIDLVRDKIVLEDQSAKSKTEQVTINGKKVTLGIITIPTFYIDFAAASRGEANYKSTTRDVKKLIDGLQKENINGLIIDLRNNGGGSLQEAIELTGLFIKKGAVVQVKYTDGNTKVEQDMDNGVYYNGPLVVLVNRFSASASEIFSAAMQDYQRGMVVGERTFGKGTVQNMVDLNDFISYNGKKLGQVKWTTAKFYRITGGSTQHKGVTPDIEIPSLFDSEKYGEDASPYALPWDQILPAQFDATSNITADNINTLKNKHTQRKATNPEFTYLNEDILELKKVTSKKYINLNEQIYKQQLEKEANQKKQREEARKKDRKNKSSTPDIILEEGEDVLGDMIQMIPAQSKK
jgi:carboxyl-terminal processing protease